MKTRTTILSPFKNDVVVVMEKYNRIVFYAGRRRMKRSKNEEEGCWTLIILIPNSFLCQFTVKLRVLFCQIFFTESFLLFSTLINQANLYFRSRICVICIFIKIKIINRVIDKFVYRFQYYTS
jgi:hypothetical protein